jgi:hypothetical protein
MADNPVVHFEIPADDPIGVGFVAYFTDTEDNVGAVPQLS